MVTSDADADTKRIMAAISDLLPPEALVHRIPTEAQLARTYPSAKQYPHRRRPRGDPPPRHRLIHRRTGGSDGCTHARPEPTGVRQPVSRAHDPPQVTGSRTADGLPARWSTASWTISGRANKRSVEALGHDPSASIG